MAGAGRNQKKVARRGLMFVLSSPSGAGKTTLSRLLLKADRKIALSISVTTRPKRQAKPLPAAPAQDGSAAAQSNGAAKPAADQQSSNGAQPGKSRKAAGSPATGSAAKTSG